MKKKAVKDKRLPAKQGEYKVGDKHPPKEYQFKPGQSGNPAGPPKRRTQLWVYFCEYMEMTDSQIAKLDHKKLTQAQQTALKIVENAKNGEYTGSERLARYVIDRDEGKPVEHVVFEEENALTDEQSEEIRELLKRSFEK
jgi:hypothetical protein